MSASVDGPADVVIILTIVGAPTYAMPLVETEAIVLRTYRLGEADKIVSLFTRQGGRLRAVAAGAQRPKSRYGGTLESLSHIRLWLFERENRDLGRLNSAELIESFFDMQKDYPTHLAGQYVVEVAEQLLPEREINERAFRLLLVVLRALKRTRETARPLVYFNYWILRLGGFLPDLASCAGCGRTFGDETVYYAPGAAAIFGEECRQNASQGAPGLAAANAIPARALAAAQTSCGRPLDRWMADQDKPTELSAVRAFLELIVEAQAERKLITRGLLAEVI